MRAEFFSDIASTVLSKTLDAAAARQKSIAANIANAETPGYKRCDVSFEAELQRIMGLNDRHEIRNSLKELAPMNVVDAVSPGKDDGNNVNIDFEIASLAKTALRYRAASVLLEGKAAMLRTVITEGKG